jgi:hypothetical protein
MMRFLFEISTDVAIVACEKGGWGIILIHKPDTESSV